MSMLTLNPQASIQTNRKEGQFVGIDLQEQQEALSLVSVLLAGLHQVETAQTALEVGQLAHIAGLVGRRQVLRVVAGVVIGVVVGVVVGVEVVVVVVVGVGEGVGLRLSSNGVAVVDQAVLQGRHLIVLPLATIRKFLHFERLLDEDVLHVVRQVIDLVLLNLHLLGRPTLHAHHEPQLLQLGLVPQPETTATHHLLGLLRVQRQIIPGEMFLLTGLRLQPHRQRTGIQRRKAMNRRNLWPNALNILLMFAPGAALALLLPLASIGRLDGLENVVFDQHPQEIKRPAQLALEPLAGAESALLLVLVPLPQEQLVQQLELACLHDDLLPRAVAEVPVDHPQVFEETHQLAAADPQHLPLPPLHPQTPAQLLDRVLLRQPPHLECLQTQRRPQRGERFQRLLGLGFEFVDELSGGELGEEVVDEGREGELEDGQVLGLLLLEVGQHGLVLDGDGTHLLALTRLTLELVDIDPPLVHRKAL